MSHGGWKKLSRSLAGLGLLGTWLTSTGCAQPVSEPPPDKELEVTGAPARPQMKITMSDMNVKGVTGRWYRVRVKAMMPGAPGGAGTSWRSARLTVFLDPDPGTLQLQTEAVEAGSDPGFLLDTTNPRQIFRDLPSFGLTWVSVFRVRLDGPGNINFRAELTGITNTGARVTVRSPNPWMTMMIVNQGGRLEPLRLDDTRIVQLGVTDLSCCTFWTGTSLSPWALGILVPEDTQLQDVVLRLDLVSSAAQVTVFNEPSGSGDFSISWSGNSGVANLGTLTSSLSTFQRLEVLSAPVDEAVGLYWNLSFIYQGESYQIVNETPLEINIRSDYPRLVQVEGELIEDEGVPIGGGE